MNKILSLLPNGQNKKKSKHICSAILKDEKMVEMIFQEKQDKTQLAVFKEGSWEYRSNLQADNKIVLLPYPADYNLIKNKVILFPSEVGEYKSETDLLNEIRSFIHYYLDIDEFFEKIASYYVLFTWAYEKFNELPYLRALGDYGCGKSRFLQVIGSICYKPIFAGGATTTSPIFRILNDFRGTLILDEADFRWSDATSDIIKILNCGFAKGFPVLRSEGRNKFEVKSFNVFGPKIIATRGKFKDMALESRFLVKEMDMKNIRKDIPLNLPDSFYEEAKKIRNQLLRWRFLNYGKKHIKTGLIDRTLEPRLNQIITPLLSVIEEKNMIEDLKSFIKNYNQQLIFDRGTGLDGQVLEEILKINQEYILSEITMKEIANNFNVEIENPKEKISPRKIGWIVRERLKLKTERTRRGYVLSEINKERLEILKKKYGIKEELLKRSEYANIENIKEDMSMDDEGKTNGDD